MPKYKCPECAAVLRRAEPIPAGKKIRCPKCEAVFPARAMPEDEPAEAAKESYALAGDPKAAPKPSPLEDDEDSNPYAVIKENETEGKPEVHLGSLRDRFAKSKIGPAMFRTVIPSNWLLRLGLFSCVTAVFLFILGIWPIIFCEANPSRPFIRPRVDIMLKAAAQFSFGAIMCLGAAKMHDLTSYTWSIIGAIMALLIYVPRAIMTGLSAVVMYGPPGLIMAVLVMALALVGLWNLIVLFNPEVRAGFKERAEEISY